MLVITRKKNEAIVIGDDVTIVVVDIQGDNVRLGIEAPREVSVHRQEVFDAIRQKGPPRERPNVAGWIRIADELPSIGKPVFLTGVSYIACYLGSREHDGEGWTWTTAFKLPRWLGGAWIITSDITVSLSGMTHWHALPDPREAR